jgi:ABC-2 type transport system ATP-binding protein
MIELDHLVKRFGRLVAVDDVTLSVPAGQFFAILGPNAAGKTTTIRILTGLVKPSSGRAHVAGFDIQQDPIEARRRLVDMDEDRMRTLAQTLAARFHLESFLHLPVESLSHGTRQRVAIVSALLHEPEVFVLDEPMVGLDPQHARILKDMLKEESQRGVTIFISTHQLSVAEEMADRIGIMHEGRLIAVGTREELRAMSGKDGALEQSFLALTAGAPPA